MRRTDSIGVRLLALFASVTLIAGLIPAPALAEIVSAEGDVLGAGTEIVEPNDGVTTDDVAADQAAEEVPADGADAENSGTDSGVEVVEEDVADQLEDATAPDAAIEEETEEVADDVPPEDALEEDTIEADDKVEEADKADEKAGEKADAIEEVDDKKADAKKSTTKKELSAQGLEAQATPTITYRAHVQSIGWQDPVTNGQTAGTSGRSLRMEALRVSLPQGTSGGVTYMAHVQSIGWQDWVKNGETAGTSGRSLRVEAFKMKLTGSIANKYDIYYRTHIQRYGWLKWAKNGEATGSAGLALRMEALQVRLVPKGSAAPSSSGSFHAAFVNKPTLKYRGHVQRIGWQDWVSDGQIAGTSGMSLRVEALETAVSDTKLTGEVQLNAHVQSIGWQDGWSTSCGTSGRSLRVEAIRAKLTGDLGKYFDVYYRVHAQKIGWMGWAKNGEKAGTSAMSLRLEAIEMRLRLKGSAAPGSSDNHYIDGNTVSKMGYQNPPGFYQVSSKNVHITDAATWPWNYVTPSRIGVWATRQDCINAFIGRAREYLGTPYVWDYSCAPGVGVDCIGLVFQCAYACGMDLGGGTGYDDFNPWAHWTSGSSGWHSHDANNFWDYGNVMHVSLADRQVGDLISWAGHVAIYLGNDSIIEAYPGSVMYNSLWAHGTPRGCMRLFQ